MSETQDFSVYTEKMLDEGWPKDAIDRAIENITETTPNSTIQISGFRQMVMAAEDALELEQKRKEMMLERRREEEAKAAERDKAIQEKVRKERSESPTLEAQITTYLQDKKNIHAITAREVADCLFSKLSDTEKQYYYNRPLFAAAEMLDTPTFDTALNECIKKYHNSITMQKKINDYLDKVTPQRDRDEQQIDKLIETLPDYRKTMDDRMYQAYTAICWLEEEEMNGKREITVEEIKEDIDLERELTAAVASEINHGEPYEVAYRSGMEKVTAKVFKKAGNIRSMPRHYKEVAKDALAVGDRETLGDNIYERVQRDKELKALLDERDAEYERKLKEIEERQNKYNPVPQQQYYNQQSRGYGYNQQRRGYGYQQGPGMMPFLTKLALGHVGVGALLMLVAFLFQAPTTIAGLGAFASAYGYYTKGKNDKNALIWIVIGYAAIILSVLFS